MSSFHFGILNEQYGNWQGGVTHPYSPSDFVQRLILIFTSMSGYDEFMAGAFWFFRGLLVASILFLVIYRLLDSKAGWRPEITVSAICICRPLHSRRSVSAAGLKYLLSPNGGLREIWGMFFFGTGVLYRRFEPAIKDRWWLSLICLCHPVRGGRKPFLRHEQQGQLRDVLSHCR